MTDQPLFSVPDKAPPLVQLASGPGPAPTPDELQAAAVTMVKESRRLPSYGRFPHVQGDLPAYSLDGPSYCAHLFQFDPVTGMRGWALNVWKGTNADLHPRATISRPGLRPPALEARVDVLRSLGFEPEHPSDDWTWTEGLAMDGKTPILSACLIVRELPAAPAAAAAPQEASA